MTGPNGQRSTKAMAAYEKLINRKQELEDRFVDISPFSI